MKFTSSTYLALAVATAAVQAAPVAAPAPNAVAASNVASAFADFDFSQLVAKRSEDRLVRRVDIEEIHSIIAELTHINSKRDFVENETELAILDKRATSALVNLIVALANSGIITDVVSILFKDPTILASLLAIGKAAFSAILAQGPALLSAIWNSGLLGKVFNDFIGDSALQSAVVGIIPDLLSIAESLIGIFFGKTTGTTTTAAPAASGAAKREIYDEDYNTSEYLSKKDLLSTIESIATLIWNSGIVQTVFTYIKNNPQQVLSWATTGLKYAFSIGGEVFGYLKSSGILAKGLAWLETNGGTFLGGFAKIIASLFGLSSTTPPATTAATAPATTVSGPAATASPSNNANVLASLAAAYGGSATPAAGAAKKRRNY